MNKESCLGKVLFLLVKKDWKLKMDIKPENKIAQKIQIATALTFWGIQ
ncbi:hypothetical protein HMPREF0493_1426 [Lactobacillus amylolyticus DSM 11664]|uniref:Uncharacterized protein n=1 Tax=Lactobacillus amylolyticus DSM 11664 TaxID=585524 RepID=D4YV65_9LACO|nr:hypothetical protein [Lactobacillus amylolyticus]EFG54925.1 hypothetical protein HMPREF0493_1426 [Lactobacillus amylolyticus DSM 11664]